jgi:hypothetical protein
MPARLGFSVDSPGCVASRDIFNDGRSHFGLMVLAAVRTPKAQRTGPDASQALAVSPKLKINGFPRFGATTTEILHGRLHLKGDREYRYSAPGFGTIPYDQALFLLDL